MCRKNRTIVSSYVNMKGSKATLFLLLATFSTVLAFKSYEGYQVIRTSSLKEDGLRTILRDVLSKSQFQIWREPRLKHPAEILVDPEHATELWKILEVRGLEPQIHISNVEAVLKNERRLIQDVKKTEKFNHSRNVTFERYLDLDEVSSYLNDVVASYPEIASIESIGLTFEGRTQNVLKLSNGAAPGKIGIFVDAAIHAAEWQAPMVAVNTIFQLTSNLSANQEFLDMADWYILPVANPDGYVFSWTQDRLWRKTRRPNTGSDCYGADPNRNFDNHWGEGGENDPCLWNYPGPNVYSEIEAKNIADYLVSLSGKLHLYLAMHSFGELLLHPYGYTTTELPPNYDDLNSAAKAATEVLESVRGTKYTYGSSAIVLYLAFGNTQDFAYEGAGIPFSYTWELPEGGPNGHDPPATEIKPVVEECWAAYKELVRQVYSAQNP